LDPCGLPFRGTDSILLTVLRFSNFIPNIVPRMECFYSEISSLCITPERN